MSKSNFYNPEKAREEKLLSATKKTEQEKATAYLERLKRDKNFQKYIVEDIIRGNIKALTDTTRLELKGKGKEDIADLILSNIKASQTLTNILVSIIS